MKITVSQYAKSLYEATQEKSQEEMDAVVAGFFAVLKKNGQMKMVKKIIEKFTDIWNKENGIVEGEITASRKLEEGQIKKIEDFIREKYSAKGVVLTHKIDESIKGGIIVRVGDELMDASVRKKLLELRNSLIA